MNHPEYQKFYDEFRNRLLSVRDAADFRKECERIQDELEEEQRQTEKVIEKLTGRSAAGVKIAYSPHQAARDRLIAKQAAATAAMLDLQSAYQVRTFSSDVVRPKIVTKNLWHLIWRVPIAAFTALLFSYLIYRGAEAFISLFSGPYAVSLPARLPGQFQDPSVSGMIGAIVGVIAGIWYFLNEVQKARRGE